MTNDEAISQLNSIAEDAATHINGDEYDDVWKDDLAAIRIAIKAIRSQPSDPLTVTFPCKIGDTIYEIEEGFLITSFKVVGFVLGKTEFEEDDDVEDRFGWQVDYRKPGIDCECPISEFGKTLFLTRKAAKQAKEKARPNCNSNEPTSK